MGKSNSTTKSTKPPNPGRMLRQSMATNKGVANLDLPTSGVLCRIIPFLNGYGKMLGSPAVIKDLVFPLAKDVTIDVIKKALQEIDRHTGIKWFDGEDGRKYIHAINFEKYQALQKDRLGTDLYPDYPGYQAVNEVQDYSKTTLRPLLKNSTVEVEVEVEVEGEVEGEGEGEGEENLPLRGQNLNSTPSLEPLTESEQGNPATEESSSDFASRIMSELVGLEKRQSRQ